MDPLIARAFATLLLSPEGINQVKQTENNMPPGRYLQAFEILRYYGIPGDEIASEREAKMKMFYDVWQKSNWKKNQIEDKHHEKSCGTKCKCRTQQQEIHEWMDYAKANYFDPLPPASKRRTTDKFQKAQEGGTDSGSKASAEVPMWDN